MSSYGLFGMTWCKLSAGSLFICEKLESNFNLMPWKSMVCTPILNAWQNTQDAVGTTPEEMVQIEELKTR